MTFTFRGTTKNEKIKFHLEVVADSAFNRIYFQDYKTAYNSGEVTDMHKYISNGDITDHRLKAFVNGWQFLKLDPYSMAEPMPQKRSYAAIKLNRDGSNIAEYLQSVRDQDIQAFNGIIDALKVVLPFAEDLRPAITSELDRKVYLMMSEENIADKLPGWLLSTGTLRILALLAVLRHPTPSQVIIIEEIENGLDPRTIHLLVDEIRYTVTAIENLDILSHNSTAFFCSIKCPGDLIVKIYDIAPILGCNFYTHPPFIYSIFRGYIFSLSMRRSIT